MFGFLKKSNLTLNNLLPSLFFVFFRVPGILKCVRSQELFTSLKIIMCPIYFWHLMCHSNMYGFNSMSHQVQYSCWSKNQNITRWSSLRPHDSKRPFEFSSQLWYQVADCYQLEICSGWHECFPDWKTVWEGSNVGWNSISVLKSCLIAELQISRVVFFSPNSPSCR